MKILILGGNGFVGKRLGFFLKGTVHQTYSASRIAGVDLTDLASARAYFKKVQPEAIYNCAAHVGSLHYVSKYAADVVYDNVQMALNLYKAALEECPKATIINPLSNCSYPGDHTTHIEDQWWNGEVHDSVFSYGNSKRFIYVLSKCFSSQYGIRTLNFLVPNTFGPGDYTDPNKTHALNGMIIRMIQAKRKGEKTFEIWGSGKPLREWGYIDDMVKIMLTGISLDHDLTYPVNIAQNKGYSIRESAEAIASALNFKGELIFNTKFQDGAPFKILDDTRFRKLYPDFKFTDHKEAIANTIQYYESVL